MPLILLRFCDVSVPKTNVNGCPAVTFTCNGNPVEQVAICKYLGLHSHLSGSVAHLIIPIKPKVGASWAAVQRCHSLGGCSAVPFLAPLWQHQHLQ